MAGIHDHSIQQQIDFLKDPQNRWVKAAPFHSRQACAVVSISRGEIARVWTLSIEDRLIIGEVIMEQYPELAEQLGKEWPVSRSVVWNDYYAKSRQEVIAVLEKALVKKEEQG